MIPQLAGLNFKQRKNAILYLERENDRWSKDLVVIEVDGFQGPGPRPFKIWRSREFLVHAFTEPGGMVRLSVNRTHVDPATMRWLDGITWDELQALKSQAGYGDREAVEIYPPDDCVVNVGSLRHLWVLPERMPFSWNRAVDAVCV